MLFTDLIEGTILVPATTGLALAGQSVAAPIEERACLALFTASAEHNCNLQGAQDEFPGAGAWTTRGFSEIDISERPSSTASKPGLGF
jgi:hypothetical protein